MRTTATINPRLLNAFKATGEHMARYGVPHAQPLAVRVPLDLMESGFVCPVCRGEGATREDPTWQGEFIWSVVFGQVVVCPTCRTAYMGEEAQA